MHCLTKFITLLIFALLVSFLDFSSHAISSDLPKPPQDNNTVKTPKNYETPKYFVPPPPFSEDIFPCSDCHEDMDVNHRRRILTDEHVEISESFNHASEQRWCLDCHNPEDRDGLRLANGDLVPFEESYNLCGQCHGFENLGIARTAAQIAGQRVFDFVSCGLIVCLQ